MFDIFAMLLSSVATFLFPVFASYKALNTSDPALLQPWLMYWVVLACVLLAESWLAWILIWIPLYPWLRAGFLLYLIAPQTQGARMLYETHLHPFLHEHELAIDDFISTSHDRLKSASLTYLRHLLELLKSHLLGVPLQAQAAPQPPPRMSYTQSLLARFNLPAARPSLAAASTTTADFYALLANAVSAATATSSATAPPNLVPPTMRGPERASFITAQRERLAFLLTALDREAAQLSAEPSSAVLAAPGEEVGRDLAEQDKSLSAAGLADLTKSRSEGDFEKIDLMDEGIRRAGETVKAERQSGGGAWMPWAWGAKNPTAGLEREVERVEDEGKSTGVDVSL